MAIRKELTFNWNGQQGILWWGGDICIYIKYHSISSVFPYHIPYRYVQTTPWCSCEVEPIPHLGFGVRWDMTQWLRMYCLLRVHWWKGKSHNRGCCWVMLFNHWSCFMINIVFSSIHYACFLQNVCKLISDKHRWQEILNAGHWQLVDMLKSSAGKISLTERWRASQMGW